jgi:hypothetical protein|tara:strand:+ start:6927 stop:7235 length:309 start_codon:yes stop_codon:yes gene_type:complete
MTKKLSRRLARKNAAKDKKRLEREVSIKMNMFDKLPDKCLTCEKPFDKQDKVMVQSWYTVVYNDKKIVRLYCPECWEKAQEILNDFRERTEHKLQDQRGGSN